MRIVIVAAGTWGDVRPNVTLGQALQAAGYDVMLVAVESFRQWVENHGLTFVPLQFDIQKLLSQLIASDTNPLATLQTLRKIVKETNPAMIQIGRDIAAVVQEGDAVLVNEVSLILVSAIVEKHKARLIHINFQPQIPTQDMPSVFFAQLPIWMPMHGSYNRASHTIFRRLMWSMQNSYGNQLRINDLGLPKQTWAKHRAILEATPSLLLVSRHVIPRPTDWQPQHRVTGYIFDEDLLWQAPQDLIHFLDEGEKPIYIGFGSMVVSKPEATTRLVLDAIRHSGRRAVLLSGWAGIGAIDLPKTVFLLKYAPHHWLFPRMAAVVHHGGAGTTAAGLAAGVPSIIVPFLVDQPYWARRVYDLGAGTKPIPRTRLSSDKLAAAIEETITNRTIQETVKALSLKIAAEDGIGTTMQAVKEFLA